MYGSLIGNLIVGPELHYQNIALPIMSKLSGHSINIGPPAIIGPSDNYRANNRLSYFDCLPCSCFWNKKQTIEAVKHWTTTIGDQNFFYNRTIDYRAEESNYRISEPIEIFMPSSVYCEQYLITIHSHKLRVG